MSKLMQMIFWILLSPQSVTEKTEFLSIIVHISTELNNRHYNNKNLHLSSLMTMKVTTIIGALSNKDLTFLHCFIISNHNSHDYATMCYTH